MKITVHGAGGGEVTGSAYLVQTRDANVLVDCGLFQGGRELNEDNAAPFGFDAAAIDHVLLTHAHLDHCGRLPLLGNRGFKGEIITSSASRELAQLVMLDSAHLQEEDARRQSMKLGRSGASQRAATPLYTTSDATRTTTAEAFSF